MQVLAARSIEEYSPIESTRLEALWIELSEAAQQMQDAKLKIVEANLLLVASIAKRYHFNKSAFSFLDVMQEGSIGLMKAVDKFDLQIGHRFSSYAKRWIMQEITQALDQQSQTVRISCYIWETRRSIEQARTKLSRDIESGEVEHQTQIVRPRRTQFKATRRLSC